jgi:SAM-dependent methyltransferase
VLHFGFVQHADQYEEAIAKNNWAHGWINTVASRLVGIDYLKNDVEKIRDKYGYEAYYGDAMDLGSCALNEQFDVVICGELIEHLTNPGLMLEGIKRFMKKDGILIITTPNVWGKTYLHQAKRSNEQDWVNDEHVQWYSFFTLANTIGRHGYHKVMYDYYYHFYTQNSYFEPSPGLMGKWKNFYRRLKMNKTKREAYLGLFFVAKRSDKSPG